ncbi:MAG: glycosyl hydrolase [Defluviitaleaceae bacterium]|nr:glycosyl hydrolase [Defluviitaleaceae bacterium]
MRKLIFGLVMALFFFAVFAGCSSRRNNDGETDYPDDGETTYATPYVYEATPTQPPAQVPPVLAYNPSPTVEALTFSEGVTFYRIWQRAAWYGGGNETQVVTALDDGVATTARVEVDSHDQIFRLIAAPGETEWFYIQSIVNQAVLTVDGDTVLLAPRDGGNAYQHWQLVYTLESQRYYELGAVTHGVYRIITNRATGTSLAHGDPLGLSNADHLPIANPLVRNQNPAPHNPMPPTHWNIAPVDFEMMMNGTITDTRNRAEWEAFAIMSPMRDRLNAAGRFQLAFTNANSFLRDITRYRVYLNNEFLFYIPQADDEILRHYFYEVEVARHTLRVDAMFGNLVAASSEMNFYVTKKGLARSAVLRVPPMGQAWFYNWGQQPMAGAEHLEFVPMQWGNLSSAGIQNNIQAAVDRGFTTFMGFNEPDLVEEASISVDIVIDRWMDSFVPFRNDIRLLSPVTAWPNSPYMHSMLDGRYSRHPNGPMALVDDRLGIIDYVDIIAYHDYATWPTFANFRSNMMSTHTLWPDHPIWITELGSRAPSDNLWPNHAVYGRSLTDNVLYNGFVELMEFMTETPWIERFAWFTFRPFNHGSPVVNGVGTQYRGMRTTYDASTGQLWPLGMLFREHGNPAGYVLPPLVPVIDAADTWDIFLPASAAAIDNLPAPVAGETAVTEFTTSWLQNATISWYPTPTDGIFAEGVAYTAVIRLQPTAGVNYLPGLIPRDFFTVEGATSTLNPHGGAIISATFPRTAGEAQLFNVTFRDWNNQVIRTDTVAYGEFAMPPEVAPRTGYVFTGWDVSNFMHINADITATAVFAQTFTVVFRNSDGAVIDTQTITYGNNATAPPTPFRDAFSDFIGWDGDFTNITSDTTLTAAFSVSDGFVPGDLAFRQPTWGSSVNPHNVLALPERAVDGDLSFVEGTYQHSSFWQAYGGADDLYHWLMIDLGEVHNISRIEIEWGRSHLADNPSDAMQHFAIWLSYDGETWNYFASVANPPVTDRLLAPLYNHITPGNNQLTTGRFIRLIVTCTDEVYTQWPRVAAFRAF